MKTGSRPEIERIDLVDDLAAVIAIEDAVLVLDHAIEEDALVPVTESPADLDVRVVVKGHTALVHEIVTGVPGK